MTSEPEEKRVLRGFKADPKAIRSAKYDAYHKDGKWLEPVCSDSGCLFCKGRPEVPPKGEK